MQIFHRTFSDHSGFTLIEVLVAVVVFTMGILAANAMQVRSIKGNMVANNISNSTSLASDRLEVLNSLNYDDIKDAEGNGVAGFDYIECCPDGNDPYGNAVAGCTEKADGCLAQDAYSAVYWNVAEDVPLQYLKSINVIVTRRDRGETKTVAVNYIKSNSL